MEMIAYVYVNLNVFEVVLHYIQLDSYTCQDRIAFIVMTNHSHISLA